MRLTASLIGLLLLFISVLTAQESGPNAPSATLDEELLNKYPDYRGDYLLPRFRENWEFQQFGKWVISNIEYPQESLDNDSGGRVVVAFIINKNGYVRHARAISTPDTLLSNELIRVLKSGQWEVPAQKWDEQSQSYTKIGMRSTIPITFKLPPDKKDLSNRYLDYGMIQSDFVGF